MAATYRPKTFTCKKDGKQFDSLADLQKHITIEHLQKGEVTSPDAITKID
ncbi:hypothetical protein Ngar_c25840 [Candidatus Nitrososphaera gargensis Ga9.2]|uniref:C2H2-type domain-containing protein n=1 Tax=Nitrososphaera gargensis (strain Ga9.2) TaxID=1237085 RepID=K0IDN5_NITGG|nr:hypothetical protein Ngar_c25840 [Candidatus Nitrososphaera gargensis Ga9.2]